LAIKPEGVYVDVTFGGGGHSQAILHALGERGKLVAFDRDVDAQQNIPNDTRLQFVAADFKFIERELQAIGITEVDGILADLGVSSHQFDTPERGFSFRFDADLDMRMDRSLGISAADVVNTYTPAALQWVFQEYGEVQNAKTLALTLTENRKIALIQTTFEFIEAIQRCINPREKNKYLAQCFQALRIEVNQEMQGLESLLESSLKLLKKGGRMSVITYHSLEDRRIKHFFRTGNLADKIEKDFFGNIYSPWKNIQKKPLMPSENEIIENPRARSAKLRIVEKN
jgi:16S rRNA (cytosine1402-N4)-methyltransferase